MNIWLVAWVFIATFILGTTFWSYTILIKQKRAWAFVANKCNLKYLSDAVLKSPTLSGRYNDVVLDIFSDQPISGKFREGGSRTIFQFTLKAPFPTQGAIGSAAFKNFIDGLALEGQYIGDGDMAFKPDIYNRVRSLEGFATYLTKERVTALNAILCIKNNPAVLIFSPSETIIRLESPDPFDDPARLEKFLTKATEACKVISI